MIVLLNSSKTMIAEPRAEGSARSPQLLSRARQLDKVLKTYEPAYLGKLMHLSPTLAAKTHQLIADWTTEPERRVLALDGFVGDIYRGLKVPTFSEADRQYADKVLLILSGLYGALRPFDAICPYRLELAYKMQGPNFTNLYNYWQDSVAACLPSNGPIINLASNEYMRLITPYVDATRIIAPQFMARDPKTGKISFVAVYAKVARGAFARWIIKNKISDPHRFREFSELEYVYDAEASTPQQPMFICGLYKSTLS